ncbi:double-strand break repair protein MRE11 [Megalopta genalis]|uniref:double-strand break repair protein MRE11 n=1 Tax=Megalopta genalis TaxID=115081 RepID=UPI003FD1B45A
MRSIYVSRDLPFFLMQMIFIHRWSRELASEYFNLFVLHKKRAPYIRHGYTSEAHFPPLIHLVVWGGEHECRITGESISKQEYYVTQPGSTVATSLCEGESKAKHIGILCVNDYRVKLKKLKLKTVRPFVFDTLNLDDVNIKSNDRSLLKSVRFNFVDRRIENKLIPRAAEQLTNHPKQPVLPYVRLKVLYLTHSQMFDTTRLTQKYCDKVANPDELIEYERTSMWLTAKPRIQIPDIINSG